MSPPRLTLKPGWLRRAIDTAWAWCAVNRGYSEAMAANLGIELPEPVRWRCTACQRFKPDIFTNGCGRCTTAPLEPVTADGTAISMEDYFRDHHGRGAAGGLMGDES